MHSAYLRQCSRHTRCSRARANWCRGSAQRWRPSKSARNSAMRSRTRVAPKRPVRRETRTKRVFSPRAPTLIARFVRSPRDLSRPKRRWRRLKTQRLRKPQRPKRLSNPFQYPCAPNRARAILPPTPSRNKDNSPRCNGRYVRERCTQSQLLMTKNVVSVTGGAMPP